MKNASSHLAILKKPYIELILAGRKTIESRFMVRPVAPMGKLAAGDTLYLKASAGAVAGIAKVSSFKEFRDLNFADIQKLKRDYNKFIMGTDEFWSSLTQKKCAVLVWLTDVRRIEPVRIQKKDWRAWVVLTREKNFGLL